jgi:hypothetical protein
MGRPPRKGMTEEQLSAPIVLLALGVTGWALVIELMATLVDKKLLTRKRVRGMLIEAANGVQELIDLGDHPVLQISLSILTGELDGWEPPAK